MKSSFAALTALMIAALVFFAYSPANAAMAGLSGNNGQTAAAELVHRTGSKSRRSMLSDGLAYGLSVAAEFTASRNFQEYSGKSREFYRERGCPKATWKSPETVTCFWKQGNRRDIFAD